MNGRLRQAMALAFAQTSPYDVRPNLLLYVLERDHDQFPKLFGYGCRYLSILFARHRLAVPEDAIQVAVVDALGILANRRAPYTLKERARALGLRQHVYGVLRGVSLRMYERRYREAFARVQAAMFEEAA